MAKLGCACGHMITDQTPNIPYKASFIRDQDSETFWKYADDIASFINAVKENRRDQWIKGHFSENYPVGISDSSIIFDIVSNHQRKLSGDIYQCEKCGRIKIQVKDTNVYSSFKPEAYSDDAIFRGLTIPKNGA
jgi:hypothetical protein